MKQQQEPNVVQLKVVMKTTQLSFVSPIKAVQHHLSGKVSQPIGDVRKRDGCRGAAGADEPAQRVKRPVHRTLAVPVVRTHVAACREAHRNRSELDLWPLTLTSVCTLGLNVFMLASTHLWTCLCSQTFNKNTNNKLLLPLNVEVISPLYLFCLF